MSGFREPNSMYLEEEDRSFPKRSDGMWMQTISNAPKKRSVRDPLLVSDITGTRPELRGSKWNKPGSDYDNYPKVHPKELHPVAVNRPMTQGKTFSLGNDDIAGSKPSATSFRTTRVTNPLDPQYVTPSCDLPPPPETKFLRNSMDISDLPGTSPKPLYGASMRPSTSCGPSPVADIPGTRPGWKASHQRLTRFDPKNPTSVMDSRADKRLVSDINSVPTCFSKTRVVNVLDPTYKWDGDSTGGPAKESKPRKGRPHIGTDGSLRTQDIHGNKPGWRKDMDFVRKQYRNINYLQDIPGAQHDTVRPHVTPLYKNLWKRSTNPLNPEYKRLEGDKNVLFWSGYHSGMDSGAGALPKAKQETAAKPPAAPKTEKVAEAEASPPPATITPESPIAAPAAADCSKPPVSADLQKDIEAVHALP